MQHIQHTSGIYGFFASVAGARRGWCAKDVYRMCEQWYNLRSDALAEYRVGSAADTFLVGMGSWHHECARSRHQVYLLHTLYRLAVSGQESTQCCQCLSASLLMSRRRGACNVWFRPESRIPWIVLWTTTEVLLHEQGPLATIWLQGIRQRSQAMWPGSR